MLDPVVLPIPAAAAILAFLVFAAALSRPSQWLTPTTGRQSRHGLASATPDSYRPRPWDEITSPVISAPPAVTPEPEEPVIFDVLDHRTPLAAVEAHLTDLGFADWWQPRELVAA
jgi:hypothetical protein